MFRRRRTAAFPTAGQIAEVDDQKIVAMNIEAGAAPAGMRQALMGGFASSKILEIHDARMVKRTFDPGFPIALHQKDLDLTLSAAEALGVSPPNTATCRELFDASPATAGPPGTIRPWSRH